MSSRKHEEKMKRLWILKVLVFAVVAAIVFSFLVMGLCNWLMPGLFGLRLISFWQAAGILILSRILFGGFRGRRGGIHGMIAARRWDQRWQHLTPEEREKWREAMRSRQGPFAPPEGGSKA